MGVYDINCSCFYKRTLLIEGGIVLVMISLRGYLNKKKLILKIGYNNNEEKKSSVFGLPSWQVLCECAGQFMEDVRVQLSYRG